jgi:hypothetical protein
MVLSKDEIVQIEAALALASLSLGMYGELFNNTFFSLKLSLNTMSILIL